MLVKTRCEHKVSPAFVDTVGIYRDSVKLRFPDSPATPTHNDDDGLENCLQFSPRIWHVFFFLAVSHPRLTATPTASRARPHAAVPQILTAFVTVRSDFSHPLMHPLPLLFFTQPYYGLVIFKSAPSRGTRGSNRRQVAVAPELDHQDRHGHPR
jgi:hypothetical protein